MVTMADRAFVDTNVVLRVLFRQFPESEACLAAVQAQWENDIDLWISRQVIRELLVQMMHPRTLQSPLSGHQVQAQMQTILTLFRVADETRLTTEQLLALVKAYPVGGKQIHDANIVATMLVHDIDRLLTLNTADFQRYADRITLVEP